MDAAPRVHAECVDVDGDVVDLLVERVLRELCAPVRRQQEHGEDEEVVGSSNAGPLSEGGTCVDSMAETRRQRELFRTEYRVVESEVVGLGVKW
jgi:hypothetical protein